MPGSSLATRPRCRTAVLARVLILALVLGCGGAGESPAAPDVVVEDVGEHASDVAAPVNIDLGAVHTADPEAAARGEAWFTGEWLAPGLIPPLALRHLYLTWEGSLLSKLKYFQDAGGYWAAFRERYGFHEAPFDNGGYPLGVRQGASGLALDCLACHAGPVGDTVVIGRPNPRLRLQPLYDDLAALPAAVAALKEADLPEPYGSLIAAAPLPDEVPALPEMTARTGAPGANDAFGLGIALGLRLTGGNGVHTHLGYQDPPAWWTLRYKRRAYTDGSGEVGSYRLMMATLLAWGLSPAALAAEEAAFADVAQYLLSLEPPRWEESGHPAPNPAEVEAGAALYAEHCAACHGLAEYPDRVVPADEVGTDPVRAERFGAAEAAVVSTLVGPEHAMTPTGGYLAPPLVGVWASAPYLHNGSVPDLASLLAPAERPARWRATGGYDPDRVGLTWEPTTEGGYDTSVEGLSNTGHDYGATLTAAERADLLAWLKTQ